MTGRAHIGLDLSGEVAWVTLSNPARRNALCLEMWSQISTAVEQISAADGVRVVVVRGEGRHFAAGADISEFIEKRTDPEEAALYNQTLASALEGLQSLEVPTVATIQGSCVGGGWDVASVCDLRIADTTAQFGVTAANIGLVYGFPSTRRLVALVGPARAKYLLFTARLLDANRARDFGLVEEVHPPDVFWSRVNGFVEHLAARAANSIRAAKEMVAAAELGETEASSDLERLREDSFGSREYTEGVAAFLEKRKPRFS